MVLRVVPVLWHGGGTVGPGLVLVRLVQSPVAVTGCNVSCWDGVWGATSPPLWDLHPGSVSPTKELNDVR